MQADSGQKQIAVAQNADKQGELDRLVEIINHDSPDYFSIIEILSLSNRSDYNTLKLCEELAELQEVLLKDHNKIPGYKPTRQAIIEEMGDVILRLMVLGEQMNAEKEIEARLDQKSAKLLKHVLEGKFKGGV